MIEIGASIVHPTCHGDVAVLGLGRGPDASAKPEAEAVGSAGFVIGIATYQRIYLALHWAID